MLRQVSRSAMRAAHQRRGFRQTPPTLDPSFKNGQWHPFRYSTDHGRAIINADTSFYDFLLYYFRLNRRYATVEGRVSNFIEYAVKNMGYVSMRSKAFNYSLHYYFQLVHRQTSNLLFNVRMQPLMMHKVHALIQYFHGGQTLQAKSIIRKPANFKYFFLWWMHKRNTYAPTYTYDKYLYARKIAAGDIKIPKMKRSLMGWRASTYNAFTGGDGSAS